MKLTRILYCTRRSIALFLVGSSTETAKLKKLLYDYDHYQRPSPAPFIASSISKFKFEPSLSFVPLIDTRRGVDCYLEHFSQTSTYILSSIPTSLRCVRCASRPT